jgi:hypothetical protein
VALVEEAVRSTIRGLGLAAVVAAAVLAFLAACGGTAVPTPPPGDDVRTWFVEVDREGGVWLGPADLRQLGLDVGRDQAPTVRLSWAGSDVPYLPLRTGEGWGLFFFAPDRATRYSRRTALRLELDAAARTMHAATPPAATGAAAAGLVTARWEQDLRYLPQSGAEMPWFWERLVAPGTASYSLVLTDALPGPVTATLHLWSQTANVANPDHALALAWDGAQVAEWTWDGGGMQHLSASWRATGIGEQHTLALEMPGLADVDLELIWLDGWEVTYRRPAEPGGTVWQAGGTALQVGDAGPDWRVIDITDPLDPLDLGPLPEDGVVGSVPGNRYWVGVPREAGAPLEVRPARELDLDALHGVEYLALAPAGLQPPLQPLLDHRRDGGLSVAVVDPLAVYDTLGTGRPDPAAMRALAEELPGLRYLLLVGDGSSEPGGYDGEAGKLRVVVPVTRTAALAETPADRLLGVEGVAVGRLPAESPGQVTVMVDKTLGWEARESPPSILLLSDDERQFATMVDGIATRVPEGNSVQRLDVGEDSGRDEILAALRDGAAWLSFSGHGSPTQLCDEGILTIEDGEAWPQPAVVVAWTCLAAHFVHPTQDSLAEVWLRAPRGGALAFLGPVGETMAGEQQPLAWAFYEAVLAGERLGDAWLAALQAGRSRDVAVGFVLLGDPALRLLPD